MNKIYKKRGEGKTSELIKRADKCNGFIVVHNSDEAKSVFRYACSMRYDINFPLTYNEVCNNQYYAKNSKCLHIDNVEMFLKYVINDIEIASITLTEEEE